MVKKKLSRFEKIALCANIAAIISILFALYVFTSDKCQTDYRDKQEYLNKLNAIQLELGKNLEYYIPLIKSKEIDYLNASEVAYFRYTTGVSNNILAQGSLRDQTLIQNLDIIVDNENEVNRILDLMALIAGTYQTSTPQDDKMMTRRLKDSYASVVGINRVLEMDVPLMIDYIDTYAKEVSDSKTYWYCKR